jgi:hypothetical protein
VVWKVFCAIDGVVETWEKRKRKMNRKWNSSRAGK